MGSPAGPGASYPMDVFYSLKNGVQKTDSNRTWHLAFQLTPFPATNVSILANHVGGSVKVFSLHQSATVAFDSLSAADTVGLTGDAQQLYNDAASWNYGAFNRLGGSTLFDFGWGTYNPASHDLTGDSLYLIKIGTGPSASVWKFWPQFYNSAPTDSIFYTFRIARFNGADDRTVTLKRADFGNLHFGHYNVLTNTRRIHEPVINTWDLVFTRYVDTAFLGGGGGALYPVTGVLTNPAVEVAQVQTLTPDTAGYDSLTYTARTNEIGYDWKITVGSGPGTTFALDTVSYFVKTKNTMEYYLLQFNRFDGSSTGTIGLGRAALGAIAVTGIRSVEDKVIGSFALVPNPATDAARVLLDVPSATTARILLSDLSGRTLYSATAPLSAGLNAYSLPTASLPAGLYVVTVSNGAWTTSGKLQISR